jgi:hypothetical protein
MQLFASARWKLTGRKGGGDNPLVVPGMTTHTADARPGTAGSPGAVTFADKPPSFQPTSDACCRRFAATAHSSAFWPSS